MNTCCGRLFLTNKAMIRLSQICSVLVIFCLGACTSTHLDLLQRDQNLSRFDKFLVFAVTPILPAEQVIEDQVVKVFEEHNVQAIAKHTLIPGAQHIDSAQFNRLIAQNQIDAILILRPVGETQNSPETSMTLPSNAYGLYNREATLLYESSDSWSRRNRQIYAQIIDIKRQQIVWYALIGSKTWTTTEAALYNKELRSVAESMANAILQAM